MLRLYLKVGFGLLGVEVGLLLLGELLQEEKGRLHPCTGRKEGFLRQTDHGPNEGAVLAELAHIGERGIIEDAFGQHDAQPSAGPQQSETAFDEKDFGLDLARLCPLFVPFGAVPFRKFEEAGDGIARCGLDASQGLRV